MWKFVTVSVKCIRFIINHAITYSTEASGQNLIFVTHPQNTWVFHTFMTVSWLQPAQALQVHLFTCKNISQCIKIWRQIWNKAIVDIIRRPRCAIPPTTSRTTTDSPNACNQACAPIVFTPWTNPIHSSVRLVGTCFPQKIAPSPSGIVTPRNTLFLRPSPLIIPNGISICSAVFVWVPNALLYNALSMGAGNPKTAPSPWNFVTLPKENRAMAIWYMHKNFGKDHACGSGDILADRRQTDRLAYTQKYSSEYFATAPAGKVKIYSQLERQYL